VPIAESTTCIIGENNTGKSNFLHAIRLCIDAGLSSTYRSLIPTDIHSTVDISTPNQVLIGLEITDFAGKTNEMALAGAWQYEPGVARLMYRFRPKLNVREDLETEEKKPGELTREDYHWEIMGGGDPEVDLSTIKWDDEVGTSIRFADLQSFLVVFLPALRDVESDLRQFRASPLARLIDAMDINSAERQTLLDVLQDANAKIADSPRPGSAPPPPIGSKLIRCCPPRRRSLVDAVVPTRSPVDHRYEPLQLLHSNNLKNNAISGEPQWKHPNGSYWSAFRCCLSPCSSIGDRLNSGG
jgi:predicted ATP-dependent endonuclease of OLD family